MSQASSCICLPCSCCWSRRLTICRATRIDRLTLRIRFVRTCFVVASFGSGYGFLRLNGPGCFDASAALVAKRSRSKSGFAVAALNKCFRSVAASTRLFLRLSGVSYIILIWLRFAVLGILSGSAQCAGRFEIAPV